MSEGEASNIALPKGNEQKHSFVTVIASINKVNNKQLFGCGCVAGTLIMLKF